MSTLPAELIAANILTRLPAKDAVTCKVICKEFLALLSTQVFERIHTSRLLHPANQKTLVIRDDTCSVHPVDIESGEYGPATLITPPFEADITELYILSHLDGLLCVWKRDTQDMLLWNPTTMAYQMLSTSCGLGFYQDFIDFLALYKDPLHDYKVMHVKCQSGVYKAHTYSRNLGMWIQTPFEAKCDFFKKKMVMNTGTQCRGVVYFPLCESFYGEYTLLAIDVSSGQVTEVIFPPVQSGFILFVDLLTVRNELHMFISTGVHVQTLELWAFRGEQWINVFSRTPIPPILRTEWGKIIHYMTKGKCLVMIESRKLYEIEANVEQLERLYGVNPFQGYVGPLLMETIVSPCPMI